MASAKKIPPGGEGKIKVTFNTKSKSGKKSQTITVFNNDPYSSSIRLKVTADIQVKLAAAPSKINFGRLKKGVQSSEKYVKLTGTDTDISKIVSVSTKNSHIKAEVVPSETEEKDNEKRIKVFILPGMKIGRFNERITINTDHREKKTLTFNVSGQVFGNITVFPSHLSFGNFKKGRRYDKKIRLKSSSNAVFKVLDVKSTTPYLTPEIETLKEGKEYLVKVFISESFDKNIMKEKIIISTDDKDQESIAVNVSGRAYDENQRGKLQNKGAWKK